MDKFSEIRRFGLDSPNMTNQQKNTKKFLSVEISITKKLISVTKNQNLSKLKTLHNLKHTEKQHLK